ncbi:hypothetical protein AB205_0134820 [Aquarana catesbeiana]|uniref:Uncharacterized protein n=1 Tax=Aquarana catesbeiana TaxID=8400 RepID=A0A2G9Q4Y0_AQUCT|nr:hypothetical protein AB205_0134820 [Aquarana catesbeiana]
MDAVRPEEKKGRRRRRRGGRCRTRTPEEEPEEPEEEEDRGRNRRKIEERRKKKHLNKGIVKNCLLGFQIPISPRPQTPTTTGQGCGDEALVLINMGTRCFGGLPQSTLSMLRACGLVRFRRGGRSLVPPSFPAAYQVACSDKGLVWIFGGTPRLFFLYFFAGFPLKSIPDLKGLV